MLYRTRRLQIMEPMSFVWIAILKLLRAKNPQKSTIKRAVWHRPLIPLTHPILNSQRRDTFKHANVICYQNQSFTSRVCRDVQIIHTNNLTAFFQNAADRTMVLWGFFIILQHFQATGEVFNDL